MIYELSPRYSGQKSFYKKAMVEDVMYEDKVARKILYLYDTIVANCIEKNQDSLTLILNEVDKYSNTTRKHVWEFIRQLTIPCFMKMFQDLKFKNFSDFLRKVDKLTYNGNRGTITLWKSGDTTAWDGYDVYHVYNFRGS